MPTPNSSSESETLAGPPQILREPEAALQVAHMPSRQFRKLRVMVVEDSRTIRELLTTIINRDPRMEVVATVDSGEQALEWITRKAPDVISMDIRLPGMNGLEATRRIMSERPTPIVVVAGSVLSEDLKISMRALQSGALTVLEKPVGVTHADYENLAERLCTQLVIMSQVKVVRQHARRVSSEMDHSADVAGSINRRAASLQRFRPVMEVEALGIVASTGGPNALLEVLGSLPEDFPVPILIVQHMTSSFMHGFISWLDENSPLNVIEGRSGLALEPGRVYVAPADSHMIVQDGILELDHSPPLRMQRPSGTRLFQSMAEQFGPKAMGVLLTGMGDDGAEGLARIHQADGYTITEDESTAVVYGMPCAAVALGASCESVPLPEIGPRICQLLLG